MLLRTHKRNVIKMKGEEFRLRRTQRTQHEWSETIKYSEENQRLGYGQHVTILIGARFYMLLQLGHAMNMMTLLRRCWYPKRDVIRWKDSRMQETVLGSDLSSSNSTMCPGTFNRLCVLVSGPIKANPTSVGFNHRLEG